MPRHPSGTAHQNPDRQGDSQSVSRGTRTRAQLRACRAPASPGSRPGHRDAFRVPPTPPATSIAGQCLKGRGQTSTSNSYREAAPRTQPVGHRHVAQTRGTDTWQRHVAQTRGTDTLSCADGEAGRGQERGDVPVPEQLPTTGWPGRGLTRGNRVWPGCAESPHCQRHTGRPSLTAEESMDHRQEVSPALTLVT